MGIGTADADVTIYGSSSICEEPPSGPYFEYNAIGCSGATFTWSVPGQWNYYTGGSGNKNLYVTSVDQYSSPQNYTLGVTITHNGQSGYESMNVTVDDCPYRLRPVDIVSTEKPEVRIYPNPVRDNLRLDIPPNGSYYMRVTALDGKVLLEHDDVNESSDFDASKWPSGSYFVHLIPHTMKSSIIVEKIIITR